MSENYTNGHQVCPLGKQLYLSFWTRASEKVGHQQSGEGLKIREVIKGFARHLVSFHIDLFLQELGTEQRAESPISSCEDHTIHEAYYLQFWSSEPCHISE